MDATPGGGPGSPPPVAGVHRPVDDLADSKAPSVLCSSVGTQSSEGMANTFNEYFASVYTEEDTSEIPIVPIVYRGNNPLRKIEITVDKVKMK